MNCYYHPDRPAVGTCKNCHRGLCIESAAEATNGLACRGRCEQQVESINDIIERNKTGYQKAAGAYAGNAILYVLLGLILVIVGALTPPAGWFLLAFGVIFLLGAALQYGTSRKFLRRS